MLEESEHKDIAYDVYQLLNGSYPLRASGFFLAFFTILGLIPATTLFIPVLRKPQEMLTRKFWKDARRGVGLILVQKMVYLVAPLARFSIIYVQTSIQMTMTRPNIWSTTKTNYSKKRRDCTLLCEGIYPTCTLVLTGLQPVIT